VCLPEATGFAGSHCCAPEEYCDDTCCIGDRACAADGRCRPLCSPPCLPGHVCCESGHELRCVPLADLCEGECCARGQRCGASREDPARRTCCSEAAWCDGVCCGDGERCEDGACVAMQTNCDPPCGPDQSCCNGLVCCECCTGRDYVCGTRRVLPERGPDGAERWTCEPLESPPAAASWLDPNACRRPTKTNCIALGRAVGSVSLNLVVCERTYRACGASWTRQDGPFESQAGVCPPCTLPFPELCCDLWHEAERSGRPCRPSSDADCDGAPNELDDSPFDPAGD
jgi:hypothetical protein